MLVLSRQRDETIRIADVADVTVVDIRGDKVRLGVTAPQDWSVHRKEVWDAIEAAGRHTAVAEDRYLNAALELARHIRNPESVPPPAWGVAGVELLTRFRRLNPVAFDNFVK